MATPFEPDGRGLSATALLLSGVGFLMVAAIVVSLMIANSRGTFRDTVTVTAIMADVGDGLPPKSDVKFQGLRVGMVADVGPGPSPGTNAVKLRLGPEYAKEIPAAVTARVVPSNVFAVPSVQLLGNGARGLRSGARINQDTSLSTIRLQTSLDQLRTIIAAVGRDRADNTMGMLATLARATDNRGADIENSGAMLREIVSSLGKVVSPDAVPSTLDSLTQSVTVLQESAPELLASLHHAIVPLLTMAQKQQQLTELLTGAAGTLATVDAALEHNGDRLRAITSGASPMLAALGDGAKSFPQIAQSVTKLDRNVLSAWDPKTGHLQAAAIVQFTPNKQYTRADCQRYGALAAPSCATGPVGQPALPSSSIDPKAYQVPASLRAPNIGPVGSEEEQRVIAGILGGVPNAADDILFGPLARGNTVNITPSGEGNDK